jgi:hypothetical protein
MEVLLIDGLDEVETFGNVLSGLRSGLPFAERQGHFHRDRRFVPLTWTTLGL